MALTAQAVDGWLVNRKRPLIVGICGAQGCGKSTLARHLAQYLDDKGDTAAILSIDDLYLSHNARASLAQAVHPMFATRGVPGTHDVALGERVLDALKEGRPVRLPRFDKGSDNPFPEETWPIIAEPVDVVIFEGWCVGAVAESDEALASPVNALEEARDTEGLWRQTVNDALKGAYAGLFSRIDKLVMLAAPDFSVVRDWRIQQERGLGYRLKREGRTGVRVMSHAEVARFIQFYERLTRHIIREMPNRADLVLWQDAGRRIIRSQRQ